MALTGNEPINAENLRELSEAGRLGRGALTLIAPIIQNDKLIFNYLNKAQFICDLDWFSEFVLIVTYSIEQGTDSTYEKLTCRSYNGAISSTGTDIYGRTGNLTLRGKSGSIGKAYFEMDKQSFYEPKVVMIYGKLK